MPTDTGTPTFNIYEQQIRMKLSVERGAVLWVVALLQATTRFCQSFTLLAPSPFWLSPSTAGQSCSLSATSSSSSTTTTRLSAAQLLEFQEPTTGVNVKLVGSMHYNPASIELAEKTIRELAERDRLGSVVIESCDLRWNTTAELSPLLQSLLQSEMRAAHDLALMYRRPVVLGDQRINVTVDRLRSGAQETVLDLVDPVTGWKRLFHNVSRAREEALPFGSEYLNAFAFLDPKLLLASPVSFLKYPLSYAAKSPIASIFFFGLLFLPVPGDAAASTMDATTLTAGDLAGQLVGSLLETLLFARIFLKELLAERNEVLAKNILEQCRLQQRKEQKPVWQRFWKSSRGDASSSSINSDVVYAPLSVAPALERDEKTVVAVLGMAHCNGIMKLLKEQRVS